MLKKIKFNTTIKAKPARVWDVLWNDDTYRQWTKPFNEDSQATSNWKEGDEILFTDGKGSGMYSIISEREDNHKMTFKHLGILKNGVKQIADKETERWSGAEEAYVLNKTDDGTLLEVEMDSDHEFQNFFQNTFPKALQIVKEIAESKS